MPLKNCHNTFSLQRTTSSSSLRLKLCFRYTRLAIRRIGNLGRPALLRAARLPPPASGQTCRWPSRTLAGAILVLELGRQRRFDLRPRQPPCQHRQRVVQVDHGVDAARKKSGVCILKSLRNQLHLKRFSRDSVQHDLRQKASIYAGWRGFAGPTDEELVVKPLVFGRAGTTSRHGRSKGTRHRQGESAARAGGCAHQRY